jgi:GBP family porin
LNKYIAAMLLGMSGASSAFAQSSVTIYGMLDMSVGMSETGSGVTLPGGSIAGPPNVRLKRMDSGTGYGSRLGFRGIEDLGGGLRANFLLEMGIGADTGTLNQGGLAFGRQAFVGIDGPNWSLTAGRQYTPMNIAIVTSEALLGGYWGNVVNQAVGTYESIGSTSGNGSYQIAGRADNSVLLTATGGPVTGNIMVAAGNENERGTGRSVHGSVVYSAGAFRASFAYSRIRQNAEQILASASPEWLTQWMVGGNYDFGVVKMYAGAFEFKGPTHRANLSPAATLGAPGANAQAFAWDKNRIYWVGARVPFGQSAVVLQAARESYPYTNAPEGRSTILAAIYEYALSKRTLIYTSYGQVNNNDRARTPLYGAIPLVGPNGFGADVKALSVGLRHTF